MRLQVNQRGSWSNCVSFPDNRETFIAVGEAAEALAKAIGGKISFRLLDSQGEVMGYLDGPGQQWRMRTSL